MASSLFGWELLFGSVEKDVKNKQDILICLTHLVLVSNGFKCVGLGESKNIDGSEAKSEGLPKGWNEEYAIRYVYQGKLYNLKGTSLDDGIIINLVRIDERTVGTVQLNVRQVAERRGLLDEMIPDNANIVKQIKQELIDKVVVSIKNKDTSSQTEPDNRDRSSVRVPPRDPLRSDSYNVPNSRTPFMGPYDYGRSDLDPFGVDPLRVGPRIGSGIGGGGGMLFDPSRGGVPGFPGPGNLGVPPGSVPPGARFDPFRPPESFPNPRGPRRPDNDELPPPGYDDMFG